jgi:transcriptional regulator with XRE-family HTH domain
MSVDAIFPNNLAAEREAGGAGTAEELARRVGIDPALYAQIEAGEVLPSIVELESLMEALGVDWERLYSWGLRTAIGGVYKGDISKSGLGKFYRGMRDPTRLLVLPEEMAWIEKAVEPDDQCEVFVNLSCSTQENPVLMLDTIAVLRKLGISFAAGAGSDFCCGGYFRALGHVRSGEHMVEKNEGPALARGASTHVHWCTQCINNYTATANRRVASGGEGTQLRHMGILDFLAERLEQLGDDVPWVRSVDRKVVVHGHDESYVTARTTLNLARVLEQVPGVQVLGRLERVFMDNYCFYDALFSRGYEDAYKDGAPRPYPATPQEMQEMRHELAAIVRSKGADTVSPQHQDCVLEWGKFASVDLPVRHAVSIVAEALGCENPDRAQAAAMLGDPDAVVEQTRPVWTSWGLTEDQAREIAHRKYNTVTAGRGTGCNCSGGSCGKETATIDVLQGVDWTSAVSVGIGEGSNA